MEKRISSADRRHLERFEEVVRLVKSGKKVIEESKEQKEKRIKGLKADYNAFCQYYFSHYTFDEFENREIDNAPFHNAAAKRILENPRYHGVHEWFRGAAKSVHHDIFIPLFLMVHGQMKFMVLAGENEDKSKGLLIDIQAELEANERFLADYGKQLNFGTWADGNFTTIDGVRFQAIGLGQSPRGLRQQADRPDYIIADDCDSEKLAKNADQVAQKVKWILRALIGTMDKGFARFIFINNRMSHTGLLAKLVEERQQWHHDVVNALDKDGKVTWRSKYKSKYFADKRREMGDSAFEAEYQNNPSIGAGVFKEEWIAWKKPLENWVEYDALVMYCDPSFSTSTNSDFTAIKLWAKKGQELICLKAYCRQNETIEKALKWWLNFVNTLESPVKSKLKLFIEGNATQKIIIEKALSELPQRLDARIVENKTNKEDRIASMIAAYENGKVFYSLFEQKNADMRTSINQLLEWSEAGKAHDDSPDADEGAWAKLEKPQRGETIVERFFGRSDRNR